MISFLSLWNDHKLITRYIYIVYMVIEFNANVYMHLHVVIYFANQFVQGKNHLNLQMNQEATKAFSSLKVTYGMAIALGHNIIIRLGLGLGLGFA